MRQELLSLSLSLYSSKVFGKDCIHASGIWLLVNKRTHKYKGIIYEKQERLISNIKS
jgi:hypothetical protein